MEIFTIAICTFNRADYLPNLVAALRQQKCPISFEILVVDNNSNDATQQVLKELASLDGVPLRFVKETKQGIVHARNRSIIESKGSAYMAFIDDDELPGPLWLQTAVDALDREGAECVGGEIQVHIPEDKRPSWLTDELLAFLGRVYNGREPFWIKDRSTPVWSGNVAYRTSVFNDGMRFDERYNREGYGLGGGEDEILFRQLLERKCKIRYRAEMLIDHLVGDEKIRKSYFLRLHFDTGRKFGQYGTEDYPLDIMGISPFMMVQTLRQWVKAVIMHLKRSPDTLRQAMNGTHAIGMLYGRYLRWKQRKKNA